MKTINTLALLLCIGLATEVADTNASAQVQQANTPSSLSADSIYQLMSAEMALNREDYETALQNYILAAKETQDAKIAARATQIALTISALDVAIEPAMLWANAAPNSLEANLTVAAIFVRLQDHQQGADYLQKVKAIEPEHAYYHYLLLYRQLHGTNGDDVIATLKLMKNDDTASQLALADIYLAQEQYTEVEVLADKVLKLTPTNPQAIRLKAECLKQRDGNMSAIKFLRQHVQANPKHTDLTLFFVNFLLSSQQFDEAKQYVNTVLKQSLTPDQSLSLARTAMQAGWYELAKNSLMQTINSSQHQDTAHYLLARISELKNDPEAALKWYQHVLTGPFHVMSQIKASQLLAEENQHDQAITILSNTQPQNEFDQKRIIMSLVDIHNHKKDYAAGIRVLDDALKYQPEDTDLLYARAVNLDKMSLFPQAEKDLLLILQQDPYHVEALNALGYMLTINSKRYTEAQTYLIRALELAPNDASVLDSMGWLQYQQGNLEEALGYLRKAAKIMPDAEIAAHLGEVLWKLNNKEEANSVWESALKVHPNAPYITEAIERLRAE